jgi:hypothetical protein
MRFLLVMALVGCGSDAHQIAIGPPPGKTTEAVLAGPLCSGDRCKCRSATDDAGVPQGDQKRYEIRLKSAQALWATVHGNKLFKNAESPEACFYVDLPAGDTPVELRASDPNGVSAEWAISELGTKTKSWYDTFHFECGNPGVCSFEEIDAKKAEYAQMKRGLRDACGSTRIKGVSWDTGKAPDNQHPSELLVRLTLDVYKFAPEKEHGDPACTK